MPPRLLLSCGLVSSLLYVATDICAALGWHGYDYTAQAISEYGAIGAPTRLSIGLMTSTTRSRPWTRASTRSPTDTCEAGFAVRPLMRTCPALHNVVASERVVHRRTAHSHRSMRADSVTRCPPIGR